MPKHYGNPSSDHDLSSRLLSRLSSRLNSRLTSLSALALSLAIVLGSAGCANVATTENKSGQSRPAAVDPIAPLLINRFGPAPAIEDAAQLHRLTPAQLVAFKKYLQGIGTSNTPVHERVASYLGQVTENFAYDEKTQSAEVSLATRSGNCMSLAVLTTALAEAADIEIGYQLINSSPVFQWEGDLVLKGQHLRSVLFRPDLESNNFTFFRSGIRIDYFPGPGERYVRKVSRAEYLSMYYNNLAADALGQTDHNRTWWLLQKSMEHQPNNVDALNVFALLYRRTGDAKRAEQIYRQGIASNPEAVVLMRNYRTLLRSLNREDEAEAITKALAGLEGAHPVDWLQAGSVEFHNQNYKEAIRYFNKAVELAPYLHEAYLGLAQAYYALKDTRQTRRSLEQALANANRTETRSLYEAKLGALASGSGRL